MSNTPIPYTAQEVQPFHEVAGIELLRHMRKTPTLLYGLFLELVRQLYTNAADHPMGTPVKVWARDQTEIWIDTELEWEDKHPELRPAIYVKLSPITYETITGRSDNMSGKDLVEAETHYARKGTGTVTFVHVGGTATEAMLLGDATMDYLDAFAAQIRDDFCFMSFFLISRVPKALREKESKERYESSVTFQFMFQDRWTIKLESQKLKVLTLRAGQRLLDNGTV